MKKTTLLIVIGAIVLCAIWAISIYNKLVKEEEQVSSAWAQVENAYQRRADLIPNLVKTVKGAADFEKGTLEAVIEARSKATSTTIDPTNLTEENMAAFQAAQDNLSSALSRLLVVVEQYPELKANQNFLELQSQLEGTENRISVERNKFNEAAQSYNTKRRTFPTNIIASIFSFGDKPYFKAQEGADKAPKVDFGTSEGK